MFKVLTIGMVSFLYPTVVSDVLANIVHTIHLHVDLKRRLLAALGPWYKYLWRRPGLLSFLK